MKCEEDNIENCQIHDWESEKREEKCTKGNEGDSSDVGSWKKVYWRCELDESINMSLVGRRELFIRISILGMKFKENLTVNHSIHWPWNYVVSHSFWKPFLIIQFFMPVISSDERRECSQLFPKINFSCAHKIIHFNRNFDFSCVHFHQNSLNFVSYFSFYFL